MSGGKFERLARLIATSSEKSPMVKKTPARRAAASASMKNRSQQFAGPKSTVTHLINDRSPAKGRHQRAAQLAHVCLLSGASGATRRFRDGSPPGNAGARTASSCRSACTQTPAGVNPSQPDVWCTVPRRMTCRRQCLPHAQSSAREHGHGEWYPLFYPIGNCDGKVNVSGTHCVGIISEHCALQASLAPIDAPQFAEPREFALAR